MPFADLITKNLLIDFTDSIREDLTKGEKFDKIPIKTLEL